VSERRSAKEAKRQNHNGDERAGIGIILDILSECPIWATIAGRKYTVVRVRPGISLN